jgi:hypothetical protein
MNPAPPTRPRELSSPFKDPEIIEVHQRNQAAAIEKFEQDVEQNREKIRRRKTPRAVRPSDPIGFVPRELRYSPYGGNGYSPIRTEAEWRRTFWVSKDGTVETPRLTFSDLQPEGATDLDGVLLELAQGGSDASVEDQLPDEQIQVVAESLSSRVERYVKKPADRELVRIARLMGAGKTQLQIAKRLGLSPQQVQRRIAEINKRCNARSTYLSAGKPDSCGHPPMNSPCEGAALLQTGVEHVLSKERK